MLHKILSRLLTIFDSQLRSSPHGQTHTQNVAAENEDGSCGSIELESHNSALTLTTSNIKQWPDSTICTMPVELSYEERIAVHYMAVAAMMRHTAGMIEAWD